MRQSFKLSVIALVVSAFAISESNLDADILLVPEQFSTIQSAIDAAVDGDIVDIGIGVYTGDGNRDIRFQGKAITVRGRYGPNLTIVDAEGTPEKPYRAFIFDSGETLDSVVLGLSICGGATLPGAILDQFNGGGLFFFESSATIKDCIISDNQCGCWGAGIYCGFNSSPVFIGCDISHNAADDDGGAVFLLSSNDVTFVNCNLNNNFATAAGGAIADFGGGGQLSIINCNLINNESNFGSAILGFNSTIANSIIWNNFGNDPIYQNWPEIQYSIVQGGYEGVGNLDANPRFVDLVNDNYRLSAGSPAFDAADNTAIPEYVVVDANGHSRFQDNPNVADTGIAGGFQAVSDIGPIEYFTPNKRATVPYFPR